MCSAGRKKKKTAAEMCYSDKRAQVSCFPVDFLGCVGF